MEWIIPGWLRMTSSSSSDDFDLRACFCVTRRTSPNKATVYGVTDVRRRSMTPSSEFMMSNSRRMKGERQTAPLADGYQLITLRIRVTEEHVVICLATILQIRTEQARGVHNKLVQVC